MQLPKYIKKKTKLKLKVCRELGCAKEYWGHVISKYCPFHSDIKNRSRKRKKYGPDIINQKFVHKFDVARIVKFTCALHGCNNVFTVRVLPKIYIIPKYCNCHRSEFKRLNFLREQKVLEQLKNN